jgi:predicted RNA binding protein YcfA (HicA-like mRNA interferase family)
MMAGILARTRGSHQVWRHPEMQGTIILAPHSLNAEVPSWLYNQVILS